VTNSNSERSTSKHGRAALRAQTCKSFKQLYKHKPTIGMTIRPNLRLTELLILCTGRRTPFAEPTS